MTTQRGHADKEDEEKKKEKKNGSFLIHFYISCFHTFLSPFSVSLSRFRSSRFPSGRILLINCPGSYFSSFFFLYFFSVTRISRIAHMQTPHIIESQCQKLSSEKKTRKEKEKKIEARERTSGQHAREMLFSIM